MGILISKKEIEKMGIRENDEVLLDIHQKGNPLREMFGTHHYSKPTEELIKESRKNISKYWD